MKRDVFCQQGQIRQAGEGKTEMQAQTYTQTKARGMAFMVGDVHRKREGARVQ